MKKFIIIILLSLFIGSFAFAQYSASFWYPNNSDKLQPVVDTWGLQITPLANCDTIDTDADGVFSCGTDATGAGGSAIIFDIGDDGGNDSVDVTEIATTGDTNNIFTEPANDKILIAVGNNWPTADLATTATTANAGDAAVDFFGAGVDAVTDATTCTNIEGSHLSITTGTLNVADDWWNNLTDMVLTNTYIYVGNVSNDPVGVTMSNDCTISNTGAITCDHDALDNFLANEHLDWTGDLGATNIHAGNYTDTDTTYVSSDFTHDDLTGFVANEHLDWTGDLGAVNIHAGNYTTLTNLTDFDQTAWRLFYSNNLGDVIELSLGTDGQYLKSQGGTASLTWGVPTDTNTNANTICAGGTTYLDGEGNCDDISSVYQPLDAQLTDLADGTLTGNFINTANPWADNEVANNITIDLATLATTVTVEDESADTSCYVGYFTGATGSLGAKTGTNLTFNSSSGVLTATGFAGPLVGNVTGDCSGSSGSCTGEAATVATINGLAPNTATTQAAQGNITSLGTLSALTMGGDIAMGGNNIDNGGVIFLTEQADADADVAGKGQIWVNTATPNELWWTDDAGTDVQLGAAGATPTDITVADESVDATCFIGFFTAATGDLEPKTGTNVTFNSATGILTATGFVGNVTGDCTGSSGSCTGNSATVTGYTPASGSITLAGADALTITTTAATGVTLPTSGTLYGTAADTISSANLLSSLSDETGTGLAVFGTSPTFLTGITVPANSISDDEINEGDTFEWTAAHTWTGALTVGVDNTGHDVIFYGATSGRLFQWDESADKLIIDGASEFGDQTNKVIISNAGVLTFGGTADIDLPNDSVDAADINTINCGTNCTWDAANDEIDIDDAFITDGASDVMTGTLTADGLTLGANENITLGSQTLDHDGTDFVFNDTVTITGDSGGVDDASVPMTLYNTDDTPPAASGFPIGTIYIKYTP